MFACRLNVIQVQCAVVIVMGRCVFNIKIVPQIYQQACCKLEKSKTCFEENANIEISIRSKVPTLLTKHHAIELKTSDFLFQIFFRS